MTELRSRKCWKCHGAGWLERYAYTGRGCSACNGAGRIEYRAKAEKVPVAGLSIDEINARIATLYPNSKQGT